MSPSSNPILDGIHHVAIICSDYERSKHFYLDVLGGTFIAETWRAERQSWKLDIRIGDSQIELFSFPSPPPRLTRPEACGLRHLALRCNDILSFHAYLEARGVITEPIRLDELTGRQFFFFNDPDNLPLEIYES